MTNLLEKVFFFTIQSFSLSEILLWRTRSILIFMQQCSDYSDGNDIAPFNQHTEVTLEELITLYEHSKASLQKCCLK